MDKAKVLVVDDIPENIHTLKNLLKDKYNIIASTSGKKAVELVKKDPLIDLIILDILMPEMDGYEVCKVLKENQTTKEIPIVFVTSLNDSKSEEKGLLLGASDYIHKPINPLLTLNRVELHIKLKRYKTKFGEINTDKGEKNG